MRSQASVYSKRAVGILLMAAILSAGCDVVKVKKGESDPGTLQQGKNLSFEEEEAGDGDPIAWDRRGGDPDSYLFAVDQEIKKSGKSSASIRLKPGTAGTAELDTSLIQCLTSDSFV